METTTNYSEYKKEVEEYFAQTRATLTIPLNLSQDVINAIYVYLHTLIHFNNLEIPGYNLKGYSASYFDKFHYIHNFYFELNPDPKLTIYQISDIIRDIPNQPLLLHQDDGQPDAFYTTYGSSLYITIIGEA